MNPLAAPGRGVIVVIFGALLGTAPVVKEKSALVQVVAAERATTRNTYGFCPLRPSSSVRWIGSPRSTGAVIAGAAPAGPKSTCASVRSPTSSVQVTISTVPIAAL